MAQDGASTDLDIFKREEDAGSFFMSSGAWMRVAPFHRFIFDSHIADIAWSMLGTTQLVLFYDFLLVKEAYSNSARTPWHQDHSYYPLDGTQAINCWLALDDIPLESALRFMQASHRPGQLYRAVDFDRPEIEYRHARKELPLPPGDGPDWPANILSIAVSAGDILIWKSYTLHSAPGNSLDHRRAAFSVNWLGDDIVYNGKPSLETYRDPSQEMGKIYCLRQVFRWYGMRALWQSHSRGKRLLHPAFAVSKIRKQLYFQFGVLTLDREIVDISQGCPHVFIVLSRGSSGVPIDVTTVVTTQHIAGELDAEHVILDPGIPDQ